MFRYRFRAEEDDDFVLMAGYYHILLNLRKKRRRFWVRPTLRRRTSHGVENLISDIRKDDIGLSGEIRSSFTNYLRMSSEDFESLLQLVGPAIQKKNTNFRNSISITERLAVTLRFLATGDSYHSLMYQTRISKQSISQIVPETCEALVEVLNGFVKVSKLAWVYF